MRYTVNLDCKTHHIDRNNEVPILLRVSINSKHTYINTGKKINVNYYDSSAKKVKSGIKGYTQLASFIDSQKEKIHTIMDDFLKRGEIANAEKLKEAYNQETGKVKSDCFYDYVEKTIQWERNNSAITKSVLNHYEGNLKKLKAYRKNLSIHDIDKPFLESYKAYILNTLKQAPNTAFHEMCFIRKYTKKLFDDGRIRPYPFAKFKVGNNFEGNRSYLEQEELEKLHALYDSEKLVGYVKKAKSKHAKDFNVGTRYQDVLRYFLVSCYCGLRHSDIKTLSKKDIKGDTIVKEMKKGRLERKKTVSIPMSKKLISLLDMENASGKLFEKPVMETSQTNKYLKAIMKIAGIEKHITFHCARHTFAVISLIKGLSMEVISNILGHSELATTQRYAKIVNRLKIEQMKKWDDEGESISRMINCPKCKKSITQLDVKYFALKTIPINCPHCSNSFNYKLN